MTQRAKIKYSDKDLKSIEIQRQFFLNEKLPCVIYENQEKIANKIIETFNDRQTVISLVIARTQSGKTGSMCSIIKKYIQNTTDFVPIQNIYIITGLSSTEWKLQTKQRMPIQVQKRVFHRQELLKQFICEIKKKQNTLIIIDEIQVAAKKDQTIHKTFTELGLMNLNNLYKNDIKIILFTATPDGLVYEFQKWGQACKIILAGPGKGYISSYDLLLNHRVKQYKKLSLSPSEYIDDNEILENIKEIKEDILKFPNPRFHIIRTTKGKTQTDIISNFRQLFEKELYDFINYDISNTVVDINHILKKSPSKHTLIFIKDKLRCAKTLYKKYLGVLYERFATVQNDNIIIQGLLGRLTGYDDNGDSVCYTNIASILTYEELWDTEFTDDSICWKSSTTKIKNEQVIANDVFCSPDIDDDIKIIKVKTFEECKKYYNDNIKGSSDCRAPRTRKLNDKGFYETVINGKRKVYSFEEVYKYRKKCININQVYSVHPCYADIKDTTTLEFWIFVA